LVGEYDSAGVEIKAYGWRLGATWSTDPVFMKQGTEYYWYHNDHLGTPQKLTTTSGAVVWSAKYTSFLEATVDASLTIENNLRAPGQYFDAETGLHYNYHRYYNFNTGRYLKIDPINTILKEKHPFLYANNQPINFIDPYGLKDFNPVPPSGCSYYGDRCKAGVCNDEKEDMYACYAEDCCKAFGDNPKANCVRGCLIEFDKKHCSNLKGKARNKCRQVQHVDCYTKCLNLIDGAKYKAFGPPGECKDAMDEIGGMPLFP
jgi:RHS repeat-associated protein